MPLLPGEAIASISAAALRAWNRAGRLAMSEDGPKTAPPAAFPAQGGLATVFNATGAPLPAGSVVEAERAAFPGGTDAFRERVSLMVRAPGNNARALLILLEDAAADPDRAATALASGVAWVRVRVRDAEHRYARALPGNSDWLESAHIGFFEILTPPAAAGEQGAYVRFPAQSPPLFPVALAKTGGEAGSGAAPCSWIYNAWPFPRAAGGEALATGIDLNGGPSPFRRWPAGKAEPADFGLAMWSENAAGPPELLLMWVNEVPEVIGCDD